MIKVGVVYILLGLVSGGVAIVSGRDRTNPRRFNNAAFWGLYSVTFLVGPLLPDVVNGVIVLLMAAVAGIGKLGPIPAEMNTREDREGHARPEPRGAHPRLHVPGERSRPGAALTRGSGDCRRCAPH